VESTASASTLDPVKAIGPSDRCDSCIQKAVYLVKFPFGELFFCRHHFIQHEEALLEKAYDIYDEQDFLED
jgi:hypothetical protein